MPVNGTELFVNIMGSGEPVVILHGGPGLSHDYFLPHFEPLADNMKLVFFDQRGMGRSTTDLDSTTFSLDLLVEDIEVLRRELKLGNIHLMGHSWGGALAMRYAINYPDRLKTLILSNSVPASSEFTQAVYENLEKLNNERQNMADIQPLMDRVNGGSRDVQVYDRFMQLNFRPSFYDTSNVNELRLNLSEQYLKTQELLQYLPPVTEPVNLFPELEQVTVSSLIIRSELDAMPVEADQKLEQTLPDARLVNIEKAGHFPFIEQPEEFFAIVSEFIREHS